MEHGVDPGRVLTFPLPVDTARIQLHDIDYASATIGFASGFTRYQNLETAVTHYPDIALAWEIAGSGPEFDAVSSACLTRLDGGVRLLGPLAPPELSRRRCHWSAFYMPPPQTLEHAAVPRLSWQSPESRRSGARRPRPDLASLRRLRRVHTHGESALLYDPSSDVAETLRLFEGMRAADRQVMGQAARDLALGFTTASASCRSSSGDCRTVAKEPATPPSELPDMDEFPRTQIILEVASNHNGDLDTARELIAAAAEVGADYVKFQSYQSRTLVGADERESQRRAALELSTRTTLCWSRNAAAASTLSDHAVRRGPDRLSVHPRARRHQGRQSGYW